MLLADGKTLHPLAISSERNAIQVDLEIRHQIQSARISNHSAVCGTSGFPEMTEKTMQRLAIAGALKELVGLLAAPIWPSRASDS